MVIGALKIQDVENELDRLTEDIVDFKTKVFAKSMNHVQKKAQQWEEFSLLSEKVSREWKGKKSAVEEIKEQREKVW